MNLARSTAIARRVFCRAWLAVVLASLATFATTTTSWADPADTDDEDSLPTRLPGLVATYSHPASKVEFSRYEAIPACQLATTESPDPRLPAGGWQAQWRGVIEILRPGKYQFDALVSGRVELSIAGKPVALGVTDNLKKVGDGSAAVDLGLGLHRIDVAYQPAPGEAARLRLHWQSEAFEREPLPSQALGHAVADPAVDDQFLRGRLAVEEHSCVACHRPSEQAPLSRQLATRQGPRLTAAGSRLKAGWIYHWLADPAAVRPEALMPRLFSSHELGDAERYAVAVFLAGQGGPPAVVPDPPDEVIRETVAAGAARFARTGCALCHEAQGDRPAQATLKGLSQKTTPEAIEAFLQKPEAVATAGRMPTFVLGKLDKHELAMYLIYKDAAATMSLELPAPPSAERIQSAFSALGPTGAERAAFAALSTAQQLPALGRQVMRARNCAACHELKPQGEDAPWKPAESHLDFLAIAAKSSGGCLAASGECSDEGRRVTAPSPDRAASSRSPCFSVALDREGIVAFLRAATAAPATPAPADAARLALVRFNCLACHDRDGAGGLTPEFTNRIGTGQDGASELVTPPSLTQVTAKLSGRALRGVLEGDDRSRPWMSLQMPRFARQHMADLPRGLASLDAQTVADSQEPVSAAPPTASGEPPDAALAEAGRTLVGSRGFGCTKCHDMLGVPSTGVRGPDLANVAARINRPWYDRWMNDPQRIQPGTRMPTVFLNGASPYKDIVAGDPARQREVIWHYLAAARSLPPPEGLEQQKLQTLAAGNRPLAVRTFLPGTTPRGIAVRFPNGVHAAFDAQMGRLAFLWSGEFLDMGPVWNGRGGHPAHLLGNIFWTAPAGCPWAVTTAGAAAPNFAGRGEDPSLGALVRDGQLHPSRLSFVGYKVDESRSTFHYRMTSDGSSAADITERLMSLRSDAGMGVLRDLSIAAPNDSLVWLHAAESDTEPQWSAGESSGAFRAGDARPAADCSLRIEQGGQAILLRLRHSASAGDWLIERQADRWQVLLRIASVPAGGDRAAVVAMWHPIDAQPDTWRRLLAEELK